MRLAAVAIDRIAEARTLPLQLPLPRDPRALRLAEACARIRLAADLAELARAAGASPRTIQRLFLAETGLPFAQWRQRLRLLHGAAALGEGKSVTEAGLEAGYSGTSAFIAAFRKHFGVTPDRWLRGMERSPHRQDSVPLLRVAPGPHPLVSAPTTYGRGYAAHWPDCGAHLLSAWAPAARDDRTRSRSTATCRRSSSPRCFTPPTGSAPARSR
jgi:AraC-like DNA-binding protein